MGLRVDGANRLATRGLRPGGAGPWLMGMVTKRQTLSAFRRPACRPLTPGEFGFQRIDRAQHFSFSMSSIVKLFFPARATFRCRAFDSLCRRNLGFNGLIERDIFRFL